MTTEANITIEDSSNPNQTIKIVHISGQLDESNIDEKVQEIYKLVEANPKNLNLIYDLENLEYMNSKSIGYITDLYSKITENGGQVTISKAKANILDILQVVGLTQLIKYFDSIEEAKKSFGTPVTSTTPSTPAATSTPAPITITPATDTPTSQPTSVPLAASTTTSASNSTSSTTSAATTPVTPTATSASQITPAPTSTPNPAIPATPVSTPAPSVPPTSPTTPTTTQQ